MIKRTMLTGLLIVLLLTSFTVVKTAVPTTCEVANFYRAEQPKVQDTKVLTAAGDLEAVDVILVPLQVNNDSYKVKLTRKGPNLYKIEQSDMYIETKYCTAYDTDAEALLKVTSSFGSTKGTLTFE